MAYFYCDFRESTRQDARNFLTSLLVQLCAESDSFPQVLSDQRSKHHAGSRQPDDFDYYAMLEAYAPNSHDSTPFILSLMP